MSGRAKRGVTMNNLDSQINDYIIEVELIVMLGEMMSGWDRVGFKVLMVVDGWKWCESNGVNLGGGLLFLSFMGWSENTIIHVVWWGA